MGVSGLIGVSFHADITGCQEFPGALGLRRFASAAVKAAGMRTAPEWVVEENFPCPEWQDDHGASCLALIVPLKESSITVHTWPDRGLVCLDFFTCGDRDKAHAAFHDLIAAFKPERIRLYYELNRGAMEDAQHASRS